MKYKVIFDKGTNIFDDEDKARNFCKQFSKIESRYNYTNDRYIKEFSSTDGGCCLVTFKEVLL